MRLCDGERERKRDWSWVLPARLNSAVVQAGVLGPR